MVRPYIPNPQDCFRCQWYGHVNRTCKSGHEVHANCGSVEHVNSQENPCTASSKCVNCQGDHPAYSRGCQKWKIEKKVREINVTQVVTFPEARRIAEGLVGQPTYANVSKISLQQSQPSNNPKQSVHTAQTSTGTTLAGPRSTPHASHGPSRSSPTGPRSSPRSSQRHRIQLNNSDGSNVISRPRYDDNFSELFAKINRTDLLEKHEAQLTETRKRKTSGQTEEDKTPAKVQATETDSEIEDSEMDSGEDLLELPPIPTQQTEENTIPIPTTSHKSDIPPGTNATAEQTKENLATTSKIDPPATKVDKTIANTQKDNKKTAIAKSSHSLRKVQTKETFKPNKNNIKGKQDLSQKKNIGPRVQLNR